MSDFKTDKMEREAILMATSFFQNLGASFESIGEAVFRFGSVGININNYKSEYHDPSSEYYDPWRVRKQLLIQR